MKVRGGHIYTMTKKIRNKIIILYGWKQILCRKCGKPIQVGEKVVSKRSNKGAKRYHQSCYQKVFVA